MIPGEIIAAKGMLTLNEGRKSITLKVANAGDRPVQVGSHFHFLYDVPEAREVFKTLHGTRAFVFHKV